MAMFRIDLLMRLLDSGASETYWFSGASRPDALAKAFDLASARFPLLAALGSVQGYRITPLSDDGLPEGRQKSVNLGRNALSPTGTLTRDELDSAVLVEMADVDELVLKRLWMRFCPDIDLAYDDKGFFTPPVDFTVPFEDYRTLLKSGDWMIRRFISPTDNPASAVIVDTVSFDDTGLMKVTTVGAVPNARTGGRLKVSKYSGAFGKTVNGMRKILSILGNVYTLDAVSCDFKGVEGGGGAAYAQAEAYEFFTINSVNPIDTSSHDTGRSFFLHRGRRSKRPVCRIHRVEPLSTGSGPPT